MKEEEVKIGSKVYRIIHHDDGMTDLQVKGYDGKYHPLHEKVKIINLGWCYIIKHDDRVEIPTEFWSEMVKRMNGCTRFKEDGKVGCKDDSGEVVPAVFDQIEFLKNDQFFLLSGNRCYLISPKRGTSYNYKYHNSKFYENDKVGWRGDGEVVIPALYDDVDKLWGLEVYETVKDGGYRYLNGDCQEILTQEKENYGIGPNDPYPESLYFRRRNVSERICLLHYCDEDPDDDEVFLTDEGKHASMLSLSRDELIETLSDSCTELSLDEKCLERFNNNFSYEFSGYLAFSNSQNPLIDCMKQFNELGAHDNTWHYIFKIITAKGHTIGPEELREWRYYLETDIDPRPLSYTIGLGESEDLEPGEVNVIMITHYNERCWPGAFEQSWIDDAMTDPLDELKQKEKVLKKTILASVKKEFRDEVLQDQYKTPFWNIRYTGRPWKESEKVLNYLADKFPGHKTFTHFFLCHIDDSFFKDETDIIDQLRFSANVLKWAAKKGCEFNIIEDGHTVLDKIYECLNRKDYHEERKLVINEVTPFLIRMGAKTLKQIRQEEAQQEADYATEIEKLKKLIY